MALPAPSAAAAAAAAVEAAAAAAVAAAAAAQEQYTNHVISGHTKIPEHVKSQNMSKLLRQQCHMGAMSHRILEQNLNT